MASTRAEPKTVLLVAGTGAEGTRQALADAGHRVRESGWLDALTSARVERPDAVVVAGELPRNATEMLVRAFGAQDVWDVPVVLAGVARGLQVEPALLLKVRAIAKPAEPGSVVAAVERAIATVVPKPTLDTLLWANLDSPERRVRFALGATVLGSSFVDFVAKAFLPPAAANVTWGIVVGVALVGWGALAIRDVRSRRWRAIHVLAMLLGGSMLTLAAITALGLLP